MRLILRRKITALILSLCVSFAAIPAHATIRDAEMEAVLRAYVKPLLGSAGLPSRNVNLFVLNRPEINAFVAGGLNIFIHTGLIEAAETPDMLLAVLAHEIGHIEGAHLSKLSQAMDTFQIGQIISSIVGALIIAGGAGEGGAAVMQGGNSIFQGNLLAHFRANEQAADQAALRYLDANDISSSGMVALFKRLQREEQQSIGRDIPVYLRTHPLNAERIANARNHLNKSSIPAGHVPKGLAKPYARMRAKLYAFLNEPERALSRYSASDTSDPALYARAIAFFRKGYIDRASKNMETLIAASPDDGFLHDTYGQILFESGAVDRAIEHYARAAELLPANGIILTDLARAYNQKNTVDYTKKAIALLERATDLDATNATSWRQLSIAYARVGNAGMSHLALAEEAALAAQIDIIARETTIALSHLSENSAGYLRAKDLRKYAQQLDKQKG